MMMREPGIYSVSRLSVWTLRSALIMLLIGVCVVLKGARLCSEEKTMPSALKWAYDELDRTLPACVYALWSLLPSPFTSFVSPSLQVRRLGLRTRGWQD